MRRSAPNLAARPFVNRRPVRRATLLLWISGGLLLFGNLALYWNHFTGFSDRRQRLVDLQQKIESASAEIDELEAELRGLDLAAQNRQVGFLNAKIAERTFPWSELFDRLGEVLPRQVRLYRLTPRVVRDSGGSGLRADRPGRGEVLLNLDGAAETDDALLAFVDALFAHEAFGSPDLGREARKEKRGVVEFSLSVSYLPLAAGRPDEGVAEASDLAEEIGEEQEPSEPEPPQSEGGQPDGDDGAGVASTSTVGTTPATEVRGR